MKFRYVLKNKNTCVIHYKVYTLKQIEASGLKTLFDIDNYEIISRDRFTGLTDKNGDKIFEGAHDKYGRNIRMIDGEFKVCNVVGMPFIDSFKDQIRLFEFEIIGNIHDKN